MLVLMNDQGNNAWNEQHSVSKRLLLVLSLFLTKQILKILVNYQGLYNIIPQHRVNKRDQQIINYFYIKNYH